VQRQGATDWIRGDPWGISGERGGGEKGTALHPEDIKDIREKRGVGLGGPSGKGGPSDLGGTQKLKGQVWQEGVKETSFGTPPPPEKN